MSGFENNIINATNALIRAAMHSPNYVAGISGWTINKDGSAEFNNLNLRGTFNGNNWIMNRDGMFFYNGTPTLGNLNLAITNSNASGVDQFGNAYNPGGISIIALAGMANVLTLVDTNGNALFGVDSQGNVNAQIVNTSDVTVNGVSIVNDLISQMAQGMVNRGWTPGGTWPSTAIAATAETAILELDQILSAGRSYRVRILPTRFLPTVAAASWYGGSMRATTDGSTPTTSSPLLGNTRYVPIPTDMSGITNTTPLLEYITPNLGSDTLYRILATAFIHAGSFQYSDVLEMQIEDIGPWAANTTNNHGTAIGFGTTGGTSIANYTKTYTATDTYNYYGATGTLGSGHYGLRGHNVSIFQACLGNRAFYEGDMYGFAMFDRTALTNDLGGAVINSIKLKLTNQGSYYSNGMNIVLGWTSGTPGADPYPYGANEHEAIAILHIGKGATITFNLPVATWAPLIQSSGLKGLMIGPSSFYTGYTDQNNYGWNQGYSPNYPQLIIGYSK